jgi:actin-related protein
LFDYLIILDFDSLQHLVVSSVSKCDVDARKELLSNILLVGGGSMIDGIGPRLQYELQQLLPLSMKVINDLKFIF